MSSMAGVKGNIYEKNAPINWVNTHYIQEVSLHFLFGYTIYKKKFKQTVPIECYSLVYCITLAGLITVLFTHTLDGQLLFDTIHYMLYMIICISIAFSISKYRQRMLELNTHLDKWFHYRGLEEEGLTIRKQAESEASRFIKFYVRLMLSSNVIICMEPLIKLFFSDRSNVLNYLIFPCYLGLPLDTELGFVLTFAFEIVCSTFCYSLYCRFTSYVFSVCLHIKHQLKLMVVALETLESRSSKITDGLGITRKSPLWEKHYEKTLEKEINTIAEHLQHLIRLSIKSVQIFTMGITSTYTCGMWIFCFSGLLFYTVQKISVFIVKMVLVVLTEFFSISVWTLASEQLITSFENSINSIYFCPWYNFPKNCTKTLLNMMTLLVKSPSLKTVIGYKAKKENLGAIFNASYTYFSLIIAMKP